MAGRYEPHFGAAEGHQTDFGSPTSLRFRRSGAVTRAMIASALPTAPTNGHARTPASTAAIFADDVLRRVQLAISTVQHRNRYNIPAVSPRAMRRANRDIFNSLASVELYNS